MSVDVDNENLFKEILEKGINLFLGEGFSLLPYKGESLPTSDELCEEVRKKFNIPDDLGNDLSLILNSRPPCYLHGSRGHSAYFGGGL